MPRQRAHRCGNGDSDPILSAALESMWPTWAALIERRLTDGSQEPIVCEGPFHCPLCGCGLLSPAAPFSSQVKHLSMNGAEWRAAIHRCLCVHDWTPAFPTGARTSQLSTVCVCFSFLALKHTNMTLILRPELLTSFFLKLTTAKCPELSSSPSKLHPFPF